MTFVANILIRLLVSVEETPDSVGRFSQSNIISTNCVPYHRWEKQKLKSYR